MRCPFCKTDDDKVIDSRASNDGYFIRRRRACLACDRRFTTYERIEETPLRVVKRDGSRDDFERRKILSGLITACQKRPVSTLDLERITQHVEEQVLAAADREVHTSEIGELVMEELKRLDQVAYVRFASVYKNFESAEEFVTEVEGGPRKAARGKPRKRKAATRKASNRNDRAGSASGGTESGPDGPSDPGNE